MRGEIATLLLAIQFLTRLPVASSRIYTPERMAASVCYYPLVGILVGTLSAAACWIASLFLPLTLGVIIAVAAGILLTGAFHEDGLADTFDGIGGGQTRETALAIMKDSRIGTYGGLALVIALLLKVTTLAAMPVGLACAALAAGHGLSRLSSVLVIATSRYVRDEGTGKPVAGRITPGRLAIALATGCALLAAWALVLPVPALGFGLAGLVAGHLLMRLVFERKLGGYTGDTLGAVQQASDIGFCVGLVAWL